MSKYRIKAVTAWQVWSSSELMTVEVEVKLRYNAFGRGIAPIPLTSICQDHDSDIGCVRSDVAEAINFACVEINSILKGVSSNYQEEVDRLLESLIHIKHDNSSLRSILMATSIANLNAVSAVEQMPLWQYISEVMHESSSSYLPLPETNIPLELVNLKELSVYPNFSLLPIGANTFADSLINTSQVLYHFKKNDLSNQLFLVEDLLNLITGAIEKSRLTPGIDMAISIQIKDSMYLNSNTYQLPGFKSEIGSDEMCGNLINFLDCYPVISIQNPFSPLDTGGWVKLSWAAAEKTQIIKSNYFKLRTYKFEPERPFKAYNTITLSLNHSSTVSELRDEMLEAKSNGTDLIIEPNLGNNNKNFQHQLAIGWNLKQIRLENILEGNECIRLARVMHQRSKLDLAVDGSLPKKEKFPWR